MNKNTIVLIVGFVVMMVGIWFHFPPFDMLFCIVGGCTVGGSIGLRKNK